MRGSICIYQYRQICQRTQSWGYQSTSSVSADCTENLLTRYVDLPNVHISEPGYEIIAAPRGSQVRGAWSGITLIFESRRAVHGRCKAQITTSHADTSLIHAELGRQLRKGVRRRGATLKWLGLSRHLPVFSSYPPRNSTLTCMESPRKDETNCSTFLHWRRT